MTYRRLLALGALSLVLHLLAIGWITRYLVPAVGRPLETAPSPIRVRLLAAQPAAAPAADPAGAAAPGAPPAPVARQASAPAGGMSSATPNPVAAHAEPASTAPPAAPLPGQNAAQQMPSRYRAIMPPSATLHFSVTGPGAPAQAAVLHWETSGYAYTVRSEGVTGTLWAQGIVGDAGVAPQSAGAQRADGRQVATTFDVDTIAIAGQAFANSVGSQDGASLLLQLIGMGLAEPDQIRNEIAIYVAAGDKPEIVRFDVIEDEEISTPMGVLVTRHLTQQTRPGEPRLEIWLAPGQRWLPVQIRSTAASGAVATQTITRIEAPSPKK